MSKRTKPRSKRRRVSQRVSESAFYKWRGERPTGGYVFDIMKWDYETRDMLQAWNAAVEWLTSR